MTNKTKKVIVVSVLVLIVVGTFIKVAEGQVIEETVIKSTYTIRSEETVNDVVHRVSKERVVREKRALGGRSKEDYISFRDNLMNKYERNGQVDTYDEYLDLIAIYNYEINK